MGILPIELVAAPGIASISSSHIVKDELMGVTYMDMVTTSVGRVTTSGLDQEAFPPVLLLRISQIAIGG